MNKSTRKRIGRYALSSLMLYLFALVFSLLSLIFIVDKIPAWGKFIASFVFIVPVFYISYIQGKMQGEKLFRERASTTLSDIHAEVRLQLPYHYGVFHVLGFAVPLLLLIVFAVIFKNTALRLIVFAFEFPIGLLFSSVKVFDTAVSSPLMLAIFIPYTLLLAGMFVLGFALAMYRLKRRQAEIESEIRMFDN